MSSGCRAGVEERVSTGVCFGGEDKGRGVFEGNLGRDSGESGQQTGDETGITGRPAGR
jgi:hypothetical protein